MLILLKIVQIVYDHIGEIIKCEHFEKPDVLVFNLIKYLIDENDEY